MKSARINNIPYPEDLDLGCLFGAQALYDESKFSHQEFQQDQLLDFMDHVKTNRLALRTSFKLQERKKK